MAFWTRRFEENCRKIKGLIKVFGYIRFMIIEQNDNSYPAKLLEAGALENKIYIERITNTNSDCTSLRQAIKKINFGDVVFVVKLDHLCKDEELLDFLMRARKRGRP